MVRAACIDQNGMKKGVWSEEEDNKLRAYVLRHGHWNWRLVPKYAGLNRCGKSCRLRWMNYLRPDVKRGDFTKEEAVLVWKLHDELGNKWSAIAARLPGRTDNEIKNYWHTHFNKRRRCKKITGKPGKQQPEIFREKSSENGKTTDSPNALERTVYSGLKQEKCEGPSDVYILDSSMSSSDDFAVSEASAPWDFDPFMERDWCKMQSEPSDSLGIDDGASSSSDSFSGFIQESFVVDTSYIQELDFPLLFDDSAGTSYIHSLGFDYENDVKLF